MSYLGRLHALTAGVRTHIAAGDDVAESDHTDVDQGSQRLPNLIRIA